MLEHTVQQMTTDVVVCPADGDTSPQASRSELIAQIKALEAALAHLPEGPLLCEALQRASSRQTRLQESARLTHAALLASKSEVQRLTLELSSLGAAVAKQERCLNCLDQLKIDMESVISEMATGGAVHDEILAEARDHMTKLLDGLTTISFSCRAASTGSLPPAPALQAQPGAHACLRMLQTNAAAQAAQRAAARAAAQAAECPAPMDLDTVSVRASMQPTADLPPGATLAPAGPQ